MNLIDLNSAALSVFTDTMSKRRAFKVKKEVITVSASDLRFKPNPHRYLVKVHITNIRYLHP